MRRPFWRSVLAALALLSCAPRAGAKVQFTGYGDFRATPQGRIGIYGPPARLATLGTQPGNTESRGMFIDAIGLFATTQVAEKTKLLLDVTYRDVGQNARTIRVQYGYVEHEAEFATLKAGKIILPFGWFNDHHFYAFQRPSITAPVFQSGILGLPISDIGASAGRRIELGPAALGVDVYAVNGYGPQPGSTVAFRSASIPGALTISQNVGARDSNHKVAVGGRLDASPASDPELGVGGSYYRGEWRPGGQSPLFQMAGAHLRAAKYGFRFLAEYLHLRVREDEGFAASVGSPNWRTDGFFANLEYEKLTLRGKPFTPWVRFEDYFTVGDVNHGREALWDGAAGVSWRVLDQLWLKAQADYIYLKEPIENDLDIKAAGWTTSLGLTVTF